MSLRITLIVVHNALCFNEIIYNMHLKMKYDLLKHDLGKSGLMI